jgi:hypothetical protein
MTVVEFLKQNWMLIAGALIVIALVMIFMSMKKEKYYDYEMAGCTTCSAGDAGVFDYDEEMYQMPDDYYSDEDGDAEDDEIYEDDTFDDDNTFDTGGNDAEEAGGMDAEEAGGMDAEEAGGMDADMVFAEELMDGGMDGEEDVDMLEIDELDAEEEDYSEL